MLKLIKNTFVRITVLVILIAACLLGYAFRSSLKLQTKHALAYVYVYQGDDNYKKGKFQDAINSYNHALHLYPEHVKARYNLGNIYFAYEDYSSAVICYEEALRHSPDFINAHINLAILLAEHFFDFDRAIDEYQKVIDFKPLIIKIPYIYNNESYIVNGKTIAYYNQGLAYKAKSLMLGDDNPQSRSYLRKAAECYKNSLELSPDKYDAHYNLGTTLHLLGNFKEAQKEYCKAINIDPLNYEAHYNLAILFRELKSYDDSIAELEKAGLLLDTKGDSYITRYIYDVLNEVYQKSVIKKEYLSLVDKISTEAATPDKNSQKESSNITYINGKVVISDQLDRAMIENMKTCGSSMSETNTNSQSIKY